MARCAGLAAGASFLHILLYSFAQVIGPVFVFDLNAAETAIAAAVANVLQIWIHSNLKLDIGPLGWLFVMSEFHRAHHCASPGPARNLGNVVTLWDRLFGTFEAPEPNPRSCLGLADPSPALVRRLLGV